MYVIGCSAGSTSSKRGLVCGRTFFLNDGDGDSEAYGDVWDMYGVCNDCEKYENMDKQSAEYQKWLKSKAHANWERDHSTSNENCHRVSKLDCVGDLQKRMGKNLIALSGKSKLSDGKPVGGRAGRLTRPTIDKLQKYYGNAIRRCVDKKAKGKREVEDAVKRMQCAIKAILYHSVKIVDEKKRHQYCPDGESSWCSFKRDKAVGTNAPFLNKSHHLDPVFLEFLTPLFDRLSEKKLLKRCLPGLSQNANESVNSLLWNKCPKHRNRGIKSVETAAASAIMQFNIGAAGRHGVMKELEISGGYYTKAGSGRNNKKRVKQANARAQKRFKETRQKIRQAKLVEEARLKAYRMKAQHLTRIISMVQGRERGRQIKLLLRKARARRQGKNNTLKQSKNTRNTSFKSTRTLTAFFSNCNIPPLINFPPRLSSYCFNENVPFLAHM